MDLKFFKIMKKHFLRAWICFLEKGPHMHLKKKFLYLRDFCIFILDFMGIRKRREGLEISQRCIKNGVHEVTNIVVAAGWELCGCGEAVEPAVASPQAAGRHPHRLPPGHHQVRVRYWTLLISTNPPNFKRKDAAWKLLEKIRQIINNFDKSLWKWTRTESKEKTGPG